MAEKRTTPDRGAPSLTGRQVGAFLALWLGWTLGFGLGETLIDALIRSHVPNPTVAVVLAVLAFVSIWIGTRLSPAWRGALGLISIVFGFFGGIVGLVRRAPTPEGLEAARPVTSLVAILVAMAGSVVLGAVLLHAERLRRKG